MTRFLGIIGAAAALLLLVHPGAATAQDDEIYVLNPGDRVEVSVLEDPSLNKQVLVLPDGRISLPIAGTLKAAGKSPDQLAAEVRSRLSGIFVSPPTVTVSTIGLGLTEADAEPPTLVYVLGEVRSPGAVPFEAPLTVAQTLALAGGPGPFAARSRIQVHREVEGVRTVELFDYDALENGRSAELGPVLADGDVIIVPERSLFD